MSKRNMKPRPAAVVAPLFVSQETAHALLGISPRKFLEHVVPACVGHVVRLGRTALVPVSVVVERLAALANVDGASTDAPDGQDDDQPTTADGVLRRLGRVRG